MSNPVWLCVDPGTSVSGVVTMQGMDVLASWGEIDNTALLNMIETGCFAGCDHMAIEMVASYGMPVGRDVFETVLWIGRFVQSFGPGQSIKIYRKAVKRHLCNSTKAKDSNVRQAILDLYPMGSHGSTPQIGTKAHPGPLYGIKKHAWSALAVGITAQQCADAREVIAA